MSNENNKYIKKTTPAVELGKPILHTSNLNIAIVELVISTIIGIVIGLTLGMIPGLVLGVLTALILVGTSLITIKQNEIGLVERLKKFNRFADTGLIFIIPSIEYVKKVDTASKILDVAGQEIFTSDSLNTYVDAQVYMKIKSDSQSAYNSQYNVNDINNHVQQLTRTTLGALVSSYTFEKVNTQRKQLGEETAKQINSQIALIGKDKTKDWGIEVIKVEISMVAIVRQEQQVAQVPEAKKIPEEVKDNNPIVRQKEVSKLTGKETQVIRSTEPTKFGLFMSGFIGKKEMSTVECCYCKKIVDVPKRKKNYEMKCPNPECRKEITISADNEDA